MPILRGFTGNIQTLPPDIYVNELPAPQSDEVTMPDFVLGFVGCFDRGPLDSYVYVSETPTSRMAEMMTPVFGVASDNGELGNQLMVHLDKAKAKKAVFVRILGKGYATANLILNNRQETPAAAIKVSAKYPGAYGNIFTVEVGEGTVKDSFKLILVSDIGGKETYDNLLTVADAVKTVNSKSVHFILENIAQPVENDSVDALKLLPAIMEQTQLAGGSNGAAVTASEYIGSYDAGTGERTGLKLLELAGKQITDFAYIGFSTNEADKALAVMGEKYNNFSYCGTGAAKTVDEMAERRMTFDTDFMQMVAGDYYANTGAVISGACLSAIVHAVGNVEDSGLAKECLWINKASQEFDFDQLTTLFANEVACFTLKPSETENGALGWRMGNDYTLAQTEVDGSVVTDIRSRKVTRRRLNSWIENSLFFVAAKWQGKAMSKRLREAAELRMRTFLDNLKTPTNPLQTPKIEDYSVVFDDNAKHIDVFMQELKVKHFNTADWILLNYQGGASVEVSE